jgi:hypothetical protein
MATTKVRVEILMDIDGCIFNWIMNLVQVVPGRRVSL